MSPFAMDETSRARFASRWIRLGDPPPRSLRDARRQMHWAVQLLAAFGDSCLPHRPDGSHRAMTWSPERRAFLSGETVDGASLRLGFEPGGLAYRLFGPGPTTLAGFDLSGRTLDEATAWLNGELASRRGNPARLDPPGGPGIPDDAVGRGGAFGAAAAESAEVERWFHDASLLLEAVAAVEEGASAVLCWPARFDISLVLDMDAGSDVPVSPDEVRSIEVGMTPGDEAYDEPYWQVTPWPYPGTAGLPTLPPPARWHTGGWVGAVLRGEDLVAAGDEQDQAGRAAGFARAAIAACRALLREGA